MIQNGIQIVKRTSPSAKYLTPEERAHKAGQKARLFQALKDAHCFWSYDSSSLTEISDDTLIEMVLQYLDMREIDILFQLYSPERIKKVWLERLVPQGEYLFNINIAIACYYFHIKRPCSYVKAMATRLLNKYPA